MLDINHNQYKIIFDSMSLSQAPRTLFWANSCSIVDYCQPFKEHRFYNEFILIMINIEHSYEYKKSESSIKWESLINVYVLSELHDNLISDDTSCC